MCDKGGAISFCVLRRTFEFQTMRVFTILLYHKNIVQVKSKIRQLEELEIAEIWSKTLLFLQYVETESVPNNARADAEHQNLLHRPY